MNDIAARSAAFDIVLDRLSGLVGRPWDAAEPEPPRKAWWRRKPRTAQFPFDPVDPPPEDTAPGDLDARPGRWWRIRSAADSVQEEPFVVDPEDPPERERGPSRWRDHPAADLLRRVRPTGRAPIALVGVLALVAVVAYFALSGSPTPEPAPDLAAATVDHPTSTRAPTARPAPDVVVDVVGKVKAPGVRSLPDGARVLDALNAAGGATPDADLTTLNLARPLVDGEQIRVGLPAPIPSAADPQNPPPAGPVDLNTATVQQLDALPGVGTVTAQRILDWRARHGRYTEVAQLQEVDGIGPARYASLQELVTVR